jgi:cytosine/adenosine deaminase-related metal-dependent hydrolase
MLIHIGQRAFIGVRKYIYLPAHPKTNVPPNARNQKCNMDREVPEDNLEPSASDSIQATEELIDYIQNLTQTSDLPLIHPIITPRFAISCTPELLRGLSELAEAYNPPLHIQTHISENLDEVTKMGELFPGNTSYADVYDSFGLLGQKTILAHAVHLGDDEIDIIAKKEAGISHCPTSNFNLTSGVAPVGKYLDAGIKVNFLFMRSTFVLHLNTISPRSDWGQMSLGDSTLRSSTPSSMQVLPPR